MGGVSFEKLLNFTRGENPFFRLKGQIAASLAICPRAPLFPKNDQRPRRSLDSGHKELVLVAFEGSSRDGV